MMSGFAFRDSSLYRTRYCKLPPIELDITVVVERY